MICLGKGVCSDEEVGAVERYLARIGDRYFVVAPMDFSGANRHLMPYREASFIDPLDRQIKSFKELHELAPIF